MAIPDSLRASAGDLPLARVLRDYFGTRFVNINGGGRFFNFDTRSNNYQDDPEIGLEGESLSAVGYTGAPGLLLDLGSVNLRDISEQLAPPTEDRARRAWYLAWTYKRTAAAPSGKGPAIVSRDEDRVFQSDLLSGGRHTAVVGHCYLLRSIVPGAHDQLVVFQILAEDEHGIFISWRVLKTWPM